MDVNLPAFLTNFLWRWHPIHSGNLDSETPNLNHRFDWLMWPFTQNLIHQPGTSITTPPNAYRFTPKNTHRMWQFVPLISWENSNFIDLRCTGGQSGEFFRPVIVSDFNWLAADWPEWQKDFIEDILSLNSWLIFTISFSLCLSLM